MRFLKISDWETRPITQTWTRNMISNDLEDSQIANTSKGVISDETIVKNHPWIENPEEEIKKIKNEQKEIDEYSQIMPNINKDGGIDEE